MSRLYLRSLNNLCLRKLLLHSVKLLVDETKHAINLEIFACLYSTEVVVIAPAPDGRSEEQPPPYDPQLKELLEWQNRRKDRKSAGERDGYTNEKLGFESLPPACIAGGGCEAPSLSTHSSEVTFESTPLPTPHLQASVIQNNEYPLGPTTASPQPDSQPSIPSVHGSYSYRQQPMTDSNARNDNSSPTPNLPEIDSPPLASMMAHHTFNNGEDGLQVDQEHPTQSSIPAWDPTPSSSAVAPSTTLSTFSSLLTLPFSTVEMATSSGISTGSDLGLRWLESSRHNSYNYREPTETSSLGHQPLPARFNSDTKLSSAYQSDRIDALARVENVMARENRVVSVGLVALKKGGQSWLAYHATKSDIGRGMDWDG